MTDDLFKVYPKREPIKGLPLDVTKSEIACPICGPKDGRLEPLPKQDTWHCHSCGMVFEVVYKEAISE